jgi:hypothetical protein
VRSLPSLPLAFKFDGTPQGIIGSSFPVLLFEILRGSDEHLVRFALRHESRGILHGAGPPDHPLLHHGLDHPSHRHQREAQRLEFIHRDHESLFWLQWACGRILFPILFRIRWCVCELLTP